MQTSVPGKLGVERRHQHRPLPAQHRPLGAIGSRHSGQDLHSGSYPFDHGRPDEHGVERVAQAFHVQIGLEGVDLAPEGVAAHIDVDDPEGVLVGPAVEDVSGEQDHPGTGPEGRHPVLQAVPERIEQAGRANEERHGGGLPARQNQHVHRLQLGRCADLARLHAQPFEGGGVLAYGALEGQDANSPRRAPRR